VNEESVASTRLPPVATGRQKPAEGNSSELTADDDLDLDLDLDLKCRRAPKMSSKKPCSVGTAAARPSGYGRRQKASAPP
jgi:hypothetical protein